jgi:hypothetical protein
MPCQEECQRLCCELTYVSQARHRTLHSTIAPGEVLFCHSNDQTFTHVSDDHITTIVVDTHACENGLKSAALTVLYRG